MHQRLRYYHLLSRLPWPKSYLGKMLLVSFVGVHIPLIVLMSYLALAGGDWRMALPFLLVALLATLGGMSITLFVQWRLLAPVVQTSLALRNYVHHREAPKLPSTYTDEAGVLMSNAQQCMHNNERLLKLKHNFLAILSHDLRAPLANIVLLSEIMLDELADGHVVVEQLERRLEQIKQASAYQLELMNSILTLARSEEGKIEVTRSLVPLGELLERVYASTHVQAEHNQVFYRLVTDQIDHVMVNLDVPKTIQVLNNLVQNAIKFSAKGSPVELGAKVLPNAVEFYVRDRGPGIAPELLPNLFEPFAMTNRYAAAEDLSSGLGLWICKNFTEVQGGRIEVQSTLGVGSCFRVILPNGEVQQNLAAGFRLLSRT